MFELINDPPLHHRTVLRFGFVSVFPDEVQVAVAVIILLIDAGKMKEIIPLRHAAHGVIEHEIDNYRNVFVVEILHQIAELFALSTMFGLLISVVRFDGEGVACHVSPVVIGEVDTLLFHVGIVFEGRFPFGIRKVPELLHGHKMNGIDAQIAEMVETYFLSFGILKSRNGHRRNGAFQIGRNRQKIGKIFDVNFIRYQVFQLRDTFRKWGCRFGFMPDTSFSIGFRHNSGIRIRNVNRMRFEEIIARIGMAVHRIIVPGTVQIAGKSGLPNGVFVLIHFLDFHRNGIVGLAVGVQNHLQCTGSKKSEGS